MQDNVEEVLELLHKLLGELQSPFFKKIVVPAAKKNGEYLFQIAAPEVVSGRKKLKTLQNMWEQKQFGLIFHSCKLLKNFLNSGSSTWDFSPLINYPN